MEIFPKQKLNPTEIRLKRLEKEFLDSYSHIENLISSFDYSLFFSYLLKKVTIEILAANENNITEFLIFKNSNVFPHPFNYENQYPVQRLYIQFMIKYFEIYEVKIEEFKDGTMKVIICE
jgi:hypothetical protein